MKEYTYVMVKPGYAINSQIVEIIKGRIKNAGLKIVEQKMIKYSKADAEYHYAEHNGEHFFNDLVNYLSEDYAYGMVIYGEDAISKIRAMAGSKSPKPGEIRYDIIVSFLGLPEEAVTDKSYKDGYYCTRNVVHSSDSMKSANREIALFCEIAKTTIYENDLHNTINQ